jgi:hypothetical protein
MITFNSVEWNRRIILVEQIRSGERIHTSMVDRAHEAHVSTDEDVMDNKRCNVMEKVGDMNDEKQMYSMLLMLMSIPLVQAGDFRSWSIKSR